MRRSFFIALLLSAIFHLVLLAAPGWHIGDLFADNALPIEAHLITPAPKPVPSPRPMPGKVRHEAPAKPAPVESIQDAAPDTLAAADTMSPPTTPQAEPPKPAVAEPVPDPVAAEPAPEVLPEVAPPLPRKGRIRYLIARGNGGLVVGQAIHEWHHDGKRYVINAMMETTGFAAIFKSVKVTQVSEGGFLNGELKPEHFQFDRGGGDVASASFDWKAQQVTLNDGQVVTIADGAEDFLSMFYQLMQAAQRGEGFIMAVANGRKVERYAFEWLGEDELALKPGHFHTWHVRVRAADGGKDTTEVWLGKEVVGLPIKIRFTDRKGDVSEQVAEEIDYEGK